MRFPKSFALVMATLVAVAGFVARPVIADEAKSTGYKAEMLGSISDAESKLSDLAEAMPAAKYSWRPAKGVRSVADVFMHVAAANYGIPSMMGAPAPAGFDFEKYESSLSKKEDIQKALKESFASLKLALTNMSDEDADKEIEIFGMKMTHRAAYLMVLSHCHEHLGQSIAYARSNGVTPPWTAKQQMAEMAKGKDKAMDKAMDKDKH